MTDWFRSWHGAPTDNKWLVIARKAGVAPGLVSAVVWALLDHASQAQERGFVGDFDIETYAAFSGFDEDHIARVLEALAGKGIIVDGALASWERRQPKREDDSTARVRALREHRKRNVTQCNAPEESREDTDTKEADASLERARASDLPAEPIIPGRSEDFGNDAEAVALGLKPSASPAPDVPLPGKTIFGEVIPPSRRSRGPPRGKHALPDGYEPSARVIELAQELGFSDERFRNELAKLRDHARQNDRRCADWDAAARNWLRKAAEFVPGARPAQAGGNRGADDSRLAAMLRGAARVRNAHDVPG